MKAKLSVTSRETGRIKEEAQRKDNNIDTALFHSAINDSSYGPPMKCGKENPSVCWGILFHWMELVERKVNGKKHSNDMKQAQSRIV